MKNLQVVSGSHPAFLSLANRRTLVSGNVGETHKGSSWARGILAERPVNGRARSESQCSFQPTISAVSEASLAIAWRMWDSFCSYLKLCSFSYPWATQLTPLNVMLFYFEPSDVLKRIWWKQGWYSRIQTRMECSVPRQSRPRAWLTQTGTVWWTWWTDLLTACVLTWGAFRHALPVHKVPLAFKKLFFWRHFSSCSREGIGELSTKNLQPLLGDFHVFTVTKETSCYLATWPFRRYCYQSLRAHQRNCCAPGAA